MLGIVFTDKARETPATGADGLQVKHSEPLRSKPPASNGSGATNTRTKPSPTYKLVVPVDTTSNSTFVSTDVVHTWDVPELAGKRDAVPGKRNHVTFRADEEGVFDGRSATLSGQAYAAMRTEVEVVSPEEYEAFIKAQKEDIQAAQDRVVELIEAGETP